MSRETYDFKSGSDYLQRKLFLDGTVTVQRFEEYAYPKIARYEKIARSYFWDPEEVTLTKDKIDHKVANEQTQFIFTQNVLRQTALDSLQGKAPAQIFTPVVSVPEMELLVSCWSFFEGSIHSNSYSHIIKNIYNMPKEQFDSIHDNTKIIEMASNVGKYYNDLHVLNCKKELGIEVTEYEHLKAIWLALHASYALEALRFMVSFATSFAMVENKIYIGNGNIISLILQDELLHTEWTAYIINQVIKTDPRFIKIQKDCEQEVYALYLDVIREEKEWAEYLFQKGPVIGLNATILKEFVDFRATESLKNIGIKYLENPVRVNPIPWFNKHANPSTKQTALQENESTSYIIGAMSTDIELDKLPNI